MAELNQYFHLLCSVYYGKVDRVDLSAGVSDWRRVYIKYKNKFLHINSYVYTRDVEHRSWRAAVLQSLVPTLISQLTSSGSLRLQAVSFNQGWNQTLQDSGPPEPTFSIPAYTKWSNGVELHSSYFKLFFS